MLAEAKLATSRYTDFVVWRRTHYLLTGLLMELRTPLHALSRRAGVAVDSMSYE